MLTGSKELSRANRIVARDTATPPATANSTPARTRPANNSSNREQFSRVNDVMRVLVKEGVQLLQPAQRIAASQPAPDHLQERRRVLLGFGVHGLNLESSPRAVNAGPGPGPGLQQARFETRPQGLGGAWAKPGRDRSPVAAGRTTSWGWGFPKRAGAQQAAARRDVARSASLQHPLPTGLDAAQPPAANSRPGRLAALLPPRHRTQAQQRQRHHRLLARLGRPGHLALDLERQPLLG